MKDEEERQKEYMQMFEVQMQNEEAQVDVPEQKEQILAAFGPVFTLYKDLGVYARGSFDRDHLGCNHEMAQEVKTIYIPREIVKFGVEQQGFKKEADLAMDNEATKEDDPKTEEHQKAGNLLITFKDPLQLSEHGDFREGGALSLDGILVSDGGPAAKGSMRKTIEDAVGHNGGTVWKAMQWHNRPEPPIAPDF